MKARAEGVRAVVCLPLASPVGAWLRSLTHVTDVRDAELVVGEPASLAAAGVLARSERPMVIACLPLVDPHELLSPGAFDWVTFRADAYATTEAGLHEAVAFALGEDRRTRLTGPPRLTYLGSLGQREPPRVRPIGRSFELDLRLVVGRSEGCEIALRDGAHSDQNTVARRHAAVEREAGGVRIRCLGSTNGTWLDGARIETSRVRSGSEVAFACTHRFRLDGLVNAETTP